MIRLLLLVLALALPNQNPAQGRHEKLPRVRVIGTGGTIASKGKDSLQLSGYSIALSAREIIETIHWNRPVVLVGAMRPTSALSADGPLNFFNAVRVAISPEARGKGVLVLLNGQISSAREVTKQSTYRADAFQAGDFGHLVSVDVDRVVFYRSPTRRHTTHSDFKVNGLAALPRVDIVYS